MFRQVIKRTLATSSFLNAKYGGRSNCVLVPGDGTGPELFNILEETFEQIQAPIDFVKNDLNSENFTETEFNNLVKQIKTAGCAIKGNILTPETDHNLPKNQRLRSELDIFANVVHAEKHQGIETRHKEVDIYLIRENTEGEYSMKEHESVPGVVESLKIMTEKKCHRIADFAFKFAEAKGRKKVTAVHKANIMKKGDGLFRKVCESVAENYPNIEYEDMIVDNTCMQLVSKPEQFDVMVLPNLYGSICGNLACGLIGGSGLTAGSNYSDWIVADKNQNKNAIGLFEEATRHSDQKNRDSIANKNIANPTATLMAGVKCLEYNGHEKHAQMIRDALLETYKQGILTSDVGGNYKQSDFVDAFRRNLDDQQLTYETLQSEAEKL